MNLFLRAHFYYLHKSVAKIMITHHNAILEEEALLGKYLGKLFHNGA